MALNLSIENIHTTIGQLNRDFAGRTDSPGYNEAKLLHIHRRNRAFVWSMDMQKNLLDSILKGFYIPPIICNSHIGNGAERREVMEGGNRMTTIRRILDGHVRPLTEDERHGVESHQITLVVMRGLTSKDQRIMFRRLNKNVKVSDGQLFAMSVDDSPLVKEAYEFLNSDTYPLRENITDTFFDTRNSDNDGCSNLANAVALISGAIHGPHFITKSYNVQDAKVDSQNPVDRATILRVMGWIFEIFTMADQVIPLNDKRKRRGQWSVGKWLGAMIYDYITHNETTRPEVQNKWVRYITAVRREDDPRAEDAIKIGGAQNLTATRHLRVSTKVNIYITQNRLATDEELNPLAHPDDEEEEILDGSDMEADE